ncbi:MAG: LemA family protein [Rubrivivax sp.]|nr:LemA family protein [Rubrivivax sp.]
MSAEQIAALAAAAVLVFWMLGAYNRLVTLRTDIGQAWATLEEALRQRGDTVVSLLAALREPLAAEHGALDALLAAQEGSTHATAAMAARPVAEDRASDWVAAESALTAAASRTLALVEQQAELRAREPVAGLVHAWRELEPRLVFRRQKFNEAAFTYNAALAQFPTRLLVALFGFRRAGRI